MTYELFKRLKEAGFPLKKRTMFENITPFYWVCKNGCKDEVYKGDDTAVALRCTKCGANIVYAGQPPSLSELVEECGDSFQSLVKDSQTSYWWANAVDREISTRGDSAEEAVSNLWLKLKLTYDTKN
jgi:hypothetical protein